MSDAQHILVSGDFLLDHHIYEGERRHYGDKHSRGVKEVMELGGAALVYYLLTDLFKRIDGGAAPAAVPLLAVDEKERMPACTIGDIPDELRAYAFWRPSPEEKGAGDSIWRVKDAMGFGGSSWKKSSYIWPSSQKTTGKPLIVVISEGGMGFREARDKWPSSALDQASWIVLKTAAPVGDGPLWEYLTQPAYSRKLVVVTSAQELRKSGGHISEGLSWEDTLETAARELSPGGACAALTRCRHLFVAFESDGGLWLEVKPSVGGTGNGDSSPLLHFVYEASSIEGEHRRACDGKSFGFLSCLTAAVTWKLAGVSKDPDLESALEGGLSAMRDLLVSGHGRASEEPAGFPSLRLARNIKQATCRYARAIFPLAAVLTPVQCPPARTAAADAGNCWSILHEALRAQGQGCPEPAYSLAGHLVRRGPIALSSIPHLRMGGFMSTDRREIESLRIIRRIILDYRDHSGGDKPLSIGVFGPPGAGKSFAVKQIAKELLGNDGWMEFNLSQFSTDTRDLIGAFHQIRDRVLQGKLPVAFFDEFDSREYAWLQYLLAPMQDGRFQEGQITHPIGKCIFIFAGGTARTFASFGPPDIDKDASNRFRLAKGPDFKSRLDGYLNILGPNRREIVELNEAEKHYEFKDDLCDIYFPIRRAFIIRSELKCSPDEKLQIDPGLVSALLQTERYTHGSRSLSKILDPMRAARPGFLHRSLMPPPYQLQLHIGSSSLTGAAPISEADLARMPKLERDVREVVAQAIHETWRQLGRREGFVEPEEDVDFGRLPEFLKESNRAAADRVSEVLALVECRLEPGNNEELENEKIRRRLEYHLEMLAEKEHDGWMDWYLDQGWKLGSKKDPDARTHPCLRPYMQLTDRERNKDRNCIRHYLEYAQRAEMKIVARR